MNIFNIIEHEMKKNTWQAFDVDTKEVLLFPKDTPLNESPLKEGHKYEMRLINKP